MYIEFTFFIGIVLSLALTFAFLLENNSEILLKLNKETHLKRCVCEICTSSYFVSVFSKLWKCPFCGTLNKKNDY